MALLNALFGAGTANHYSQAFPGVQDVTTSQMQKAIRDWFDLYYNDEVEDEEDPCQRLPVAVVSKLYKACFGEYSAKIGVVSGGNEYMERCQEALDGIRKDAVQIAMIGGEGWLKPIPEKDGFSFAVVRRDAVVIAGRDASKRVTDMISAERTTTAAGVYTLLERRTVDDKGYLTITNKLYWSRDEHQGLGTPTALDSLPKYADLLPEYTFPKPVGSIGLVSLRVPTENTVDGSQDAVSIFAPAAALIHRINHNEWLLDKEFDLGSIRVFASSDLIDTRKDMDGRVIKKDLPKGLFTGLDGNEADIGIKEFAPALRDQNFLARKGEYLRNIEGLLGIKHGLLSKEPDQQRTATEISSSAGDYSLSIKDLQDVWEEADREALRLCAVLGEMYNLCPANVFDPDDLSISWGNGVLYDADKAHAENMQMAAAGMLRPELVLAWKFGLPWDTPEDLAKIREKYMPPMEQLLDEENEET